MDFDDELIAKLHRPAIRTPTPPPSAIPPAAATTSTPSNPTSATTTSTLPRSSTTTKEAETYYIKPIPSGLRGHSLSHLLTLCHNHTLHHGFDVVKKAGVKPTSQKAGRKTILPNAAYYKWHIACVLGGKPKNTRHLTDEQRKRDKSSLKQGCSSRVWAWAVDKDNPEGEWEIRWGDTDPAIHNHPPVDVRTLPNHRRRAREQVGVKEAIMECAKEGMRRKETLAKLREMFPEGLFSDKDVANELQKYKVSGGGEVQDLDVQEAEGGQEEEEMEDVGEVGDETERELQVQLQAQTRFVQGDQHHQQLLQQQMGQPAQMLQQPQQIHQQALQQSQQQSQQHQHLFAPGVPAYW